MEHFTAFDLQRHVNKVQEAALVAPVAITHHGRERLVLMDYARWQSLGRGDALADAIKRLQARRDDLRREGISSISIFGSVARGDAGDTSDIDLLVEPVAGTRVGGLTLVRWRTLLTGILGRDADVAVFEFLSDKVRAALTRDLVMAVSTGHEVSADAV